jgi:hypothetical protein
MNRQVFERLKRAAFGHERTSDSDLLTNDLAR